MYEELKKIIETSNNIVFFGGAGVSTESDIPDFRSSNGIFNQKENIMYSPERVVSHTFFMNKTEFFYDFYKNKMIYKNAKPNKAHIALAKLEEQGKLKAIITQNIDGLHQMAGSKNVLELHGSIMKNTCMKCKKKFNLDYIINSIDVPKCDECGGIVKPDVVLYEESLDNDTVTKSIDYFKGSKLILINKSTTPYDNTADIIINDSIGKVLGTITNV